MAHTFFPYRPPSPPQPKRPKPLTLRTALLDAKPDSKKTAKDFVAQADRMGLMGPWRCLWRQLLDLFCID